MNLSLSIHDPYLQRDLQAIQDIHRAQAQFDEVERIHKQCSQYDLGVLEAAKRLQQQVDDITWIQNQVCQSEIQALADLSRLADVDDDIKEIERDLRHHTLQEIHAIRRLQEQENELEHLRKMVDPFSHLKMLEAFEQCARAIRVTWRNIQYTVHRVQSHTRGKSKSSTRRKSASSGSSGNSGGGNSSGDGDGDGPARAPSKSKKPRSKPRSTSLQHPPSSPPGEIATTSSPQVLPYRPLPGREIVILVIFCLYGIANIVPSRILQGLIIFSLLIIALVAMGYPEVARYVWSTVPKLLKQLSMDADEENEDPDEES